jgi:hypothetical protein
VQLLVKLLPPDKRQHGPATAPHDEGDAEYDESLDFGDASDFAEE